jgi:hypothetical protein
MNRTAVAEELIHRGADINAHDASFVEIVARQARVFTITRRRLHAVHQNKHLGGIPVDYR